MTLTECGWADLVVLHSKKEKLYVEVVIKKKFKIKKFFYHPFWILVKLCILLKLFFFFFLRFLARSLVKMSGHNPLLRLEQRAAEADQLIEYLKQQVALLKEKASKMHLKKNKIKSTHLEHLMT